MNHKHNFQKEFEGIEKRTDGVFGIGFDVESESWVIRYKCRCGEDMEFVNAKDERPKMPGSFMVG